MVTAQTVRTVTVFFISLRRRHYIPQNMPTLPQKVFYLCVGMLFIFTSCEKKREEKVLADSHSLNYSIVGTLPHDDRAFTEGLVIHDDKILEGTGQYNQSWLAEINPGTNRSEKKVILDEQYFGEGVTVLNEKIYQLTYREKVGFIYQTADYKKIGEINYSTEGWGITHDGQSLIMSDGTDKLYFLDTAEFKIIRTLSVTDPTGARLKNLNELEYINEYIFANVYETPMIVKIHPFTGKVVGELDLSIITSEIKRMYPGAYELNGIAYDKKLNALLVTGKFWPKYYLIRIY